MPFVTGIDFLTLSRKMQDICYRAFPLIAAPERQQFKDFHYSLCTKEHCIKFVDLFTSTSLMEVLKVDDENVREDLSKILNGNTDLIPNQYEGGFKVWEGLYDLIDYIFKNAVIDKMLATLDTDQQEVNILDLGCGSGLLSIYIANQLRLKKSSLKRFKIYLQDYNDNVIKYYTIPNVLMNDVLHPLVTNSEPDQKEQLSKLVATVRSNYEFMHGDWTPVTEELFSRGIKFDLIVSAETLYSEENYAKLFNAFNSLLRQPTGQVLIATKSHYFGVGGGTWSFIDYVQQHKDQNPERVESATKKQKISDGPSLKLNADVVQEIEANLLRHVILLKWSK